MTTAIRDEATIEREAPAGTPELLAWVRGELGRFACARLSEPSATARALAESGGDAPTELRGPLANLMTLLGGRPIDLFVVGLLGAVEADARVGVVVSELQGDGRGAPGGARPTVELLVDLVSARSRVPADPLALLSLPTVAAGAIELQGDGPLPQRTLAIEPRLFALLAGGRPAWPGLRFLAFDGAEAQLPAAARRLAIEAAAALSQGARGVVVRGSAWSGREAFAACVAALLGLPAVALPLDRWQGERIAPLACRCAGWLPVIALDGANDEALARGVMLHPRGPLIALATGVVALPDEGLLEIELPLPSLEERRARWGARLGAPPSEDGLAEAPLALGLIDQLADHARALAGRAQGGGDARSFLAAARRRIGVSQLRALAQPIEREVPEGALVLPPEQAEELERLIARCRQRESLFRDLGATLDASRNGGVRALFVGESGTGKTLAASRVATALGAPLWRVDLSAVMSKWVGESEKNLARVLDAAAALDVVLLFDEADALFGQRGEASESGERWLTMLTNHLLTRLEAFGGVAILTANSRSRIDPAFLRRLDVVLEFPLPATPERRRLWSEHLGARARSDAELDFLASWCDLAGGHVRNAVLAAAARSKEATIALELLQEALVDEYRKLGRAVPGQLKPPHATGGR